MERTNRKESRRDRRADRNDDIAFNPLSRSTDGGWGPIGRPIEEGGGGSGGVDYLIGNTQSRLAGDRAIQSNGYILIDYDGDKHYDQAWFGVNGVWQTTTGGGTWVTDNGPMDELIDLWERGFVL